MPRETDSLLYPCSLIRRALYPGIHDNLCRRKFHAVTIGLSILVRVDVKPPALIAGFDRYSVVSVRRTGEHAEVSYPCVRYADRVC